ncbi:Xaa-Pro peptidase family protein [Geminicoccaceae bacterium 1502E]|nr:Xaa-Pro peptidase family protein [Geminicoccaceae bacterium 1502E]
MRHREDLVFPMAEFEARLERLRRELAARGLDAMIVTTPENLFYLTGYQTPGYYWFQALVVPVAKEPFMVTRLLEDSNVQSRTWISESHPYRDSDDPPRKLAEQIRRFGLGSARLGYERHCWFFRATEQEALMEALPEARFTDVSGLNERHRLVKSPNEIAHMRAAARATEAAMRAGIEAVGAGVSENEVAAAMMTGMTLTGSHYPAIHPFVASGWRGAIGHATWEDRIIDAGDAVFLEAGGCRHRYHTAMMRTVIVGEAAPAVHDAETVVRDAMDAAMAAIRPGVPAQEIDRVARRVIAEGTGEAVQAARSGYSIGIAFAPDWGEGHILSLLEGEHTPLEENMTFHLIPWVQVPGLAGVGLSETVRVTAGGCESLFSFERRVFER